MKKGRSRFSYNLSNRRVLNQIRTYFANLSCLNVTLLPLSVFWTSWSWPWSTTRTRWTSSSSTSPIPGKSSSMRPWPAPRSYSTSRPWSAVWSAAVAAIPISPGSRPRSWPWDRFTFALSWKNFRGRPVFSERVRGQKDKIID